MIARVFIEAQAILGDGGLFAERVISELVRLSRQSELILVVGPDDGASWEEAQAILQREPVSFSQSVRIRNAEEMVTVAERQRDPDRHIWLVTRSHVGTFESDGVTTLAVDELGWPEVVQRILFPPRIASVVRRTSETEIAVRVDLDGRGAADVATGIGFFDHMLEQLARHSGADISVSVAGDLHVDEHHTIEDTAISLGEAFGEAIGDKRGIRRYAFVLPMDDSLARVAFDWSGRSWLVWDAEFKREKIGEMPTEMFFHFFKSFSDAARCNLNISVEGDNEHHMIESVFKAVGRCLRDASVRDPEDVRVPSTKGTL
ncbi:MAG: imidazoleglycerol-phosphate dehydratase HisB [Rhodothermales bacterium]|nr:imidazoleglycerol-phosphate dehydratase HisB [Rhodothermales bacterium]